MLVFLAIGEVQGVALSSKEEKRDIKKVCISAVDAFMGGSWTLNDEAARLRQLLGCEPTEVIGIIMTEEVWLDADSIINAQRGYFTACEVMWVVRPDGKMEEV